MKIKLIIFLLIAFTNQSFSSQDNNIDINIMGDFPIDYSDIIDNADISKRYYNLKDENILLQNEINQLKINKKTPLYNPWFGTKVSFGADDTQGNSTTRNINSSASLIYQATPEKSGFRNVLSSFYRYQESDTGDGLQATNNRFNLNEKSSYFFNDNNGAFVQINYLVDKFDGYDYVIDESVGLQRLLFENGIHQLDFSIGPGIQQRRVTADNIFTNKLSLLLNLSYIYAFNVDTEFNSTITNLYTSINIRTTWVTSISTALYSNFSVSLNYRLTYNSVPENDKKNTDITTSINLIYNL